MLKAFGELPAHVVPSVKMNAQGMDFAIMENASVTLVSRDMIALSLLHAQGL